MTESTNLIPAELPEALRLAVALAYCDSSVASQAAAELRRLHAALLAAAPNAPMSAQPSEQWLPMESAPKDGTLVRLLVDFEHHATEDGEGPQPTIGANTWDNHHDFDEWQFAGWNWEQDCYTQGIGKPVGWLPMLAAALQPPAAPWGQDAALSQAARDVLAERRRQINEKGFDPAHDDEHVNDEIAAMAALFIMPPAARDWDTTSTSYGDTLGVAMLPVDWDAPRFGGRRDQLVKGAAMALAEIERFDRDAARSAARKGEVA